MIEEIISTTTPHANLKILSADKSITDNLPTIDSYISFLPFINFLKDKLETTTGIRADFYRYLIQKFESEPALLQQVVRAQDLNENEELLELLSTVIFPVVSDKHNFTLATPYQFNIFSYSDTFKKLFVDKDEAKLVLPNEISEAYLKQVQCSMIYDHVLEKYYGIKLNESPELIYPVIDEQTGMKRFYRMRYDRRFINLKLKGELPPIQDCAVCLNTFRILDFEHQLAKMPLDLFEVEGFAVWVAEDVTSSHSLEQIKKILLRQGELNTGSINELKEAVSVLIGLNDISIGLMPFVKINNCFLLNEECTRHSLIGKHWRENDETSQAEFNGFLEFQKGKPHAMPVSNVSEEILGFATFLRPLYNEGTRSYIQYSMQNNEGLIGFLEIASPVAGQLTQEIIMRLEPAIPLLSLAMIKAKDAFDNKIDQLVKEKFTALQPSVEWKFSEVAWDYLKKDACINSETGKIIFENVYPLYGSVDIRNSSTERNIAIQKDLKLYIKLVDETLDKLQAVIKLNLLEGLKFKNNNFREIIETHMLPQDEVSINEFRENEVDPVFLHLQKTNGDAKLIIDHYFNISNNCSGQLYCNRNDFEETLAAINNEVLSYLEAQEDNLQQSYPHYFEKFRTDGVEYNIYIGQSMVPNIPFDLLYLKNIRLWQLQSMAEMTMLTHKLLPSLKVPLQTTQLILIHSLPISISFRKDERRFDVEGSYNIRYEVMKKRIDKATISGTQERLTQPGKIAIIYSNEKEAKEYEEYICFLQSKKLLKPGQEFFDLDELQGVKGLKAIRVEVSCEL
ncbi:MAG: hypothetical protein QM737_01140 [Ferruginibacter sp.]